MLGVRPEHLDVAPADTPGALPITVEMEEDLGGVSYLHARTVNGLPLVLERRGNRENFEGRRLGASVRADRVLVFDDAGARLR